MRRAEWLRARAEQERLAHEASEKAAWAAARETERLEAESAAWAFEEERRVANDAAFDASRKRNPVEMGERTREQAVRTCQACGRLLPAGGKYPSCFNCGSCGVGGAMSTLPSR
jgi:hypothetical protein